MYNALASNADKRKWPSPRTTVLAPYPMLTILNTETSSPFGSPANGSVTGGNENQEGDVDGG